MQDKAACFEYILLTHVNYHSTNAPHPFIYPGRENGIINDATVASVTPPQKSNAQVLLKLQTPVVHHCIYTCNAGGKTQNSANLTWQRPVPTSACKAVILSDVLWYSSISPIKF
jgi:hypothetical protein